MVCWYGKIQLDNLKIIEYMNNLCIQPFTAAFPRADIHELIAPDLLHQVIKGTFKDHLVTWVETYFQKTYGKAYAKEMMDEID